MKNIPNILSVSRIALIPFFVWQMVKGHYFAGGVLLLVSGFTDVLDGFLARRFIWITYFGKILDPAADKLTQISIFIMMFYIMPEYWVLFLIMLGKEAAMFAAGLYFTQRGVKLEGARWFGKLSTASFYITIILILILPGMPEWIRTSLLVTITVLSVSALLMYAPSFLKYVRAAKERGKAAGGIDHERIE